MTQSAPPISPLAAADKFSAARNFETPEFKRQITENPRLIEAVLFLQWASQSQNYPGGLARFTETFIEQSEEFLGSAAMVKIGNRAWSKDDVAKVRKEFLPLPLRGLIGGSDPSDETLPFDDRLTPKTAPELFRRACVERAGDGLRDYFYRVCVDHGTHFGTDASRASEWMGGPPHYFARVGKALEAFLDRWRAECLSQIAETTIATQTWGALDRAAALSDGVLIQGTTRYGKSEAVRAWYRANAGRARLVETPHGSSEGPLLRAVGLAIGLDVGSTPSGFRQRGQIAHVLENLPLTFIFDEAQFLIPSNFSRITPPTRLNFVRREIMDRRRGTAFIVTPQFEVEKRRYVKATGYVFEQFDGRLLAPVRLPEELTEDDLEKITSHHFKGSSPKLVRTIVLRVLLAERCYASDVSRIARLGAIYASEEGRSEVCLRDIDRAIADVLPQAAGTPVKTSPAAPLQTPCNLPEAPLANPFHRTPQRSLNRPWRRPHPRAQRACGTRRLTLFPS